MSEPKDQSSDNDLIDPIEGLKQLEKLISEAKEYNSKQKSFNGYKMSEKISISVSKTLSRKLAAAVKDNIETYETLRTLNLISVN